MERLNERSRKSPAIAITGIACRYPGADGPEQFWRLLMERTDAVGEVPGERLPGTGAATARHGGLLGPIDGFDAAFFDMAPREARLTDPQLRLFLEVAWEAVEDAGLSPSRLAGSRTGVFVGQATSNYWELLCRHADPDIYGLVGSEFRASLPGRVSFHLDLRGPSVSVDTACSASLTAVHLACQSIRLGESTTALVGGVNLALLPHEGAAFSEAGMLAPDGRCKFGDAGADGFVRSDGVGVVVLRPLQAALADGDPVYAVIRGSAVNNDGRSNGLLMTPSVAGQEHMLREALRAAEVDGAEVDYVEAHGTGTKVGDHVELTALGNVLGERRPPGRPCLVGSVKSNIGHTEAAAGIAGLIKAALCVQHRLVPPTLHVREPNPTVASARSALRLPTEPRPLTDRGPVVAGVSSFGISGTNVHVVLEEYAGPRETASHQGLPAGGEHLLTLSARSAEALREAAAAAAGFLSPGGAGRQSDLSDICHTAALRRKHHENRLVALGSTHDDLAVALREFGRAGACADVVGDDEERGVPARVAFVFPGQGSQWPGMTRDLLSSSEVYREALRRCSEAVEAETGWSVLRRLETGAPLTDRVDEIQPALWAVQVALAALWRSLGVEPDLMIGHSMGEVAAACVAGALEPADAAAVICRRSGLAQRIGGRGAMVSVGLGEAAAESALDGYEDRVAVGAVNGPSSTVLSGDPAALREIGREFDRRGVFHRAVPVVFASHSPQVDELKDDLRLALREVRPAAARVPIWSTVLDELTDGAGFDAGYWVRNLRDRVRFASAVTRVADAAPTVFVEVSPHAVLTGAMRECLSDRGLRGTVTASMRRGEAAWPSLRRALASVHVAGGRVDWRRHYPSGRSVRLPSYPWQRERYWFTESAAPPAASPAGPAGPAGTRERRELVARAGLVAEAGLTGEVGLRVVQQIAQELRLPVGRLNLRRPLGAMGLDSLMAAKLCGRLRDDPGVVVSPSLLLGGLPLGDILDRVSSGAAPEV
ncbi:acyltransferase domain-containing protein [Sphaerisporangium sp. TRM90804]|uniref:type I polyketide synthase n=1 Tax=Sphaerisporangium sp. TRM90804 TaxID=3031113 RepID=UPI0024473F10|nr:acyltransferase domain-containing protein [Sphaerisporangium sp. TRM90804]MDH2426539.1 acyltransferase domain-containing protein [Sphaerisporangium sp. TRM90804]